MGGRRVADLAVAVGIVTDGVRTGGGGREAGNVGDKAARLAHAVVHGAVVDGGGGHDKPLRLSVVYQPGLHLRVGLRAVRLRGGGEVHVDVCRAAAAALVQVGSRCAVAIPREGIVAIGVEGDGGDRTLVGEVGLGVVQVDV